MVTTFDKIYSEDIIDVLVSNLRSEFGSTIKVSYSDTYEKKSNKSMRLYVVNQTSKEVNKEQFLNNYTVELKFYSIINVTTKETYKSFFYDLHRIEQSLLALQGIFGLLDFSIDSVSLNDYDDDEAAIANLYNARLILTFSKLKG